MNTSQLYSRFVKKKDITDTHTLTHTHIMLHYYLIIGSCPPLVLYATGAPAHKHTVHHWSACWKAALGNHCTSTAAAMSWPWGEAES